MQWISDNLTVAVYQFDYLPKTKIEDDNWFAKNWKITTFGENRPGCFATNLWVHRQKKTTFVPLQNNNFCNCGKTVAVKQKLTMRLLTESFQFCFFFFQ